jgi:membrane protease YdiL (CAAX protease family)
MERVTAADFYQQIGYTAWPLLRQGRIEVEQEETEVPSHESTPSRRLLKLELVVAVGLLAMAAAWDVWRQLGLRAALTTWSLADVRLGMIAAAPPLLIIPLLEWRVDRYIPGLQGLQRSISLVLAPLVGRIRFVEVLALSALAGVSEEVFFRGALQREIGVILASVIFGLFHAVSFPYVLWATAVGGYLAWLAQWHGNLSVPIVAHTMIDIAGLLYIRHVVAPRLESR